MRNQTKGQLQAMALAILGFIYIGWMFLHLAFLANCDHAYGYLSTWSSPSELNDVAAFTCGKALRQAAVPQQYQPRKRPGTARSVRLAVSMALPWLLRFSFPHFGPLQLSSPA